MEQLGGIDRLVIAGIPSGGKTTKSSALAAISGARVLHTDDLISTHEWSAASLEVSEWFDRPGPWIIEGVATVRALRKWLKRAPMGKPCDAVLWMDHPFQTLDGGRFGMARGCFTVWYEVRPILIDRGVEILGAHDTPPGALK
jgi:hypothetical protein